ncbi:flagellar biosynthesis protein FlhA [Enterocloster clostridioformis]|uniref:flagellar biosynthesis protein FlhA n=2 Tax=Enterocloster clostridioformis TaxID=1531 RepID=UPI00080CB81D|nr:flagellar biosynthesis protein FlhA [Enterocloster clostridioformis]ANU49629.1 flagellar biosynthesis protein FlhA [Lachnoclostridium sp. YL32]NDO28930.1 flagellar biosynthesis protein FlhA [Enterocloster clostridioformis]OXE71320.1 flagellar biosynthesis protein FlhA [Enterocloster clostridioformis]QQR01467.1 flagellar biosynthesis protein FlhA [Enterocloster clostridioformis]
MKKILNYSVVLFVLTIILLLIIPLPAGMVDVAIILNMALSMMILVSTMTIREPLELSIFPSLLLVTTLFRLGINVSTTRNILSNGGSSGQIIKAFGDFILRGNVVVGFIIFLIIVLMQFIVITKGAERVAEVAARFNLDAMPGKQMAIDADLSSGLINEQQAKDRRQKVQREADFYGAMDGATKIVKGDAVMSLITTAINLIGGSVIGILQSGSSIGTVLNTYSIATVGDGLVSQIPALLISVSTGMIVTRAVSDGSLNEDISRQFMSQPYAIMMSGVVMAVLTFIPGMPVLQLLIISAALISGGYYLSRKVAEASYAPGAVLYQDSEAVQGSQAEAAASNAVAEDEYFKDVNNVYTLLTVEPIEMEFGYSLIPLADESVGGRLISRIVIFRRQYAQDMGFVIPSIRLRDSSGLSTNQYCIKIKGEEVARGELLVDYYLALEPEHPEKEVDGIEAIEPAYGIPSRWIRPEDRERAELYGYTVIDPLSVMVTHLSEIIRQHAYELVTRQEVIRLIENVKKTSPELVEEAFPGLISYNLFQRVLTALLKEGVPVKDLETIIETMIETISEAGLPGRDFDGIIEQIRIALKRTITRLYCEDGSMKVITLDTELERTMAGSVQKGESGMYLALQPDILQSLISQLAEQMKKFNGLTQNPVILTSQVMRIHFYHLIEQFYPKVRVLSFNEIANNVQIQSIGSLRLEETRSHM